MFYNPVTKTLNECTVTDEVEVEFNIFKVKLSPSAIFITAKPVKVVLLFPDCVIICEIVSACSELFLNNAI